jgi:hypothetical protein
MAEVLTIEHSDWTLSVWTKDITPNRRKLLSALKRRNPSAELPIQDFEPRFNSVALGQPIFFENTQYDFDIEFNHYLADGSVPCIAHPYARIADVFHYKASRKVLSGSINFGNDIGRALLPLIYETNAGKQQIDLRFTVWPTKLDYETDLNDLLGAFQRSDFSDWPFALISATEHGFARKRGQKSFPLLWLAHFKSLWNSLAQHTKAILNAPHNRLISTQKMIKAERLTGKLSERLEARVAEDVQSLQFDRRYRTEKKTLSVNTPENRFVQFALRSMKQQLLAIYYQVSKQKNEKVSEHFYKGLSDWQQQISLYLAHPLFKEVSDFKGLSKESLVLQQRAGYAGFYRIWQELKLYLGVLGKESFVSLKSMDELYEVWCFLKVRDVLLDLGFQSVSQQPVHLKQSALEWQTQDGFGGAFHLEKSGIKIRLAHEKTFSNKATPMRSLLVSQRPDILLEATFENGEQLFWLFDAKYRLEPTESGMDRVPDDAINQMHRYRDALLYEHQETGQLSRAVFGAFALYPGFIEQTDNEMVSPYQEAIEKIGVGAFPLLPCKDCDVWLRAFLADKFDDHQQLPYAQYADTPERFYVQESARIPTYGLEQTRQKNLCLYVTGANDKRIDGYYESFANGTARYFHMQQKATTRVDIENEIVQSVAFLEIASKDDNDCKQRIARYRWPVKSVTLVDRNQLTEEQTGKKANSETASLYWLFELGIPIELENKHQHQGEGHEVKFV